MKLALMTLSLLVLAGAARAQHAEHEGKREEHAVHPAKRRAAPKPGHPVQVHPQGPAHPHPAGQLHPKMTPRPAYPQRPQLQPRPSAEAVRPASTPRPESASNHGRPSPLPMMPAPKAETPAPEAAPVEAARPRPASSFHAPRPISDGSHFVRRWSPPPAPSKGDLGSELTARPAIAPPGAQHTSVFEHRDVVARIISSQRSEVVPNHYYWHHDSGFNYVHSYHGGAHWYGFYVGPTYYWSQYHAGRWWWHDPATDRSVYYGDGNWWWQNPIQPETVFVYQNGAYVPVAGSGADAPEFPPLTAPVVAPAAAPATGSPGSVVINTAPAEPAAPVYRSDVDSPTYSAKTDPNRIALVIGVEDYATLPRADFAARDARAVRAHLAALGYADRNVVVLISSQAARASIAKFVESWLPQRATEDSRVFVYFSGHGAPDPKTGVAYLMPWDGDAKYLENTGYPLKQLYLMLNTLPAQEIVVALDSCFSGEGGRSVLVAGARPLVTNADLGRGSTGKAVVFTASGSDEITGTLPDQGHGLFTYYFLKGLNGEAAGSADGTTVQQLFDYLAPSVEDAARRENRDQTPQLLVPPDGQRKLLLKDLR